MASTYRVIIEKTQPDKIARVLDVSGPKAKCIEALADFDDFKETVQGKEKSKPKAKKK